jgi:TonB family protein
MELNAGIMEKARERAASMKPHSPRPYYWAAAAGIAILAGLIILLLFQFRPASNMEHGTSNMEQEAVGRQLPAVATSPSDPLSPLSNLETGPGGEVESGTPEPVSLDQEPANEVNPPDTNKAEEENIFLIVETMPEFPGGEEAFNRYIADSLRYPAAAIESAIQGRVFVTFVVEKDGSVSNARIRRGIGGGCDEEALRVIRNMPKWAPGKQRGQPVRVQYNMPVMFKLK